MIYSKYSARPILENDLKTITGTLAERPVESENGGDMPTYFIEFKLLNDNHTYHLRKCSYQIINKTKILNLKAGAHIKIKVIRENIAKERKLNVYTFSSSGNMDILKLDSYNRCNINSWRKFKLIIAIMFVVLLYRLCDHIQLIKVIQNLIKKDKLH